MNERELLTPSRAELRARMLALAGISVDEQASALRQAFDTSRALLAAEKTELVTYQGNYVPVQVPDNGARARAVDQIYDLVGVSQSRAEGIGGGKVVVEVVLPGWGHVGATVEASASHDEHDEHAHQVMPHQLPTPPRHPATGAGDELDEET